MRVCLKTLEGISDEQALSNIRGREEGLVPALIDMLSGYVVLRSGDKSLFPTSNVALNTPQARELFGKHPQPEAKPLARESLRRAPACKSTQRASLDHQE